VWNFDGLSTTTHEEFSFFILNRSTSAFYLTRGEFVAWIYLPPLAGGHKKEIFKGVPPMRILLSLCAVLISTAAHAADPIAPGAFLGDYDLVAQPEGILCDEHMQAMQMPSQVGSGIVEISLGAFTFIGVNNGPQRYEDNLAINNSNAFTTSDGRMVYESTEVAKADGEVTHTVATARLTGTRLTIKSATSYKHKGTPALNTEFQCVYHKID
jgi:hypothetical protein